MQFGAKFGSRALYLEQRENLLMNFFDDFKSLLFCFHTFGLIRSIDVLNPENQPGSGKFEPGLKRAFEIIIHLIVIQVTLQK